MKNLKNYNVTELNSKELINTDGGWILFVVGLVLGMVTDAQNNPDDFWAGYNSTAPK